MSDLQARTLESLRRAGLTLTEAVGRSDEQLLAIPNIGPTSLRWIRDHQPYDLADVPIELLFDQLQQRIADLKEEARAERQARIACQSQLSALIDMQQKDS